MQRIPAINLSLSSHRAPLFRRSAEILAFLSRLQRSKLLEAINEFLTSFSSHGCQEVPLVLGVIFSDFFSPNQNL